MRTPHEVSFSPAHYVSFEHKTRNRLHRHAFFEPCIVISGSGEFEHDGAVYPLRPNDLFIADPGTFHEIRSLDTRDLRLYFFALGVAPGLGGSALAAFLLRHRQHVADQAHLVPLFEHVLALGRIGEVPQRHRHDASLLLLRQIVEALTESATASNAEHLDRALSRKVSDAIESGLDKPLRMAALAAQCHVSERTLRRRWAGLSRHSLTDEIARRRVERAAQLLLLPDVSVAEVGDQVGIESPAQFSRLFKGLIGESPTAYRRRHWRAQQATQHAALPYRSEFLDGGLREHPPQAAQRARADRSRRGSAGF